MTIRTNTNPRQMDLQPEMRNLLMRNGLQAHVAFDGGVLPADCARHDSPLLVYPITERQMLAPDGPGERIRPTRKPTTYSRVS